MRIDMEQLSHRERDGGCQLNNGEVTSWFEYPIHLAQACIKVGKVADAKSGCYGVESVAVVG